MYLWRYIFRRTLAPFYNTSNECNSIVKQNFISEIHLRLFSINILIFEQPNKYLKMYLRRFGVEFWNIGYLCMSDIYGDASPIKKRDFDITIACLIRDPCFFFTSNLFQKFFLFSINIFITNFYSCVSSHQNEQKKLKFQIKIRFNFSLSINYI